MDKILLIINSLINKKLYYSNENSSLNHSLEEFYNLCNNYNEHDLNYFLKQESIKHILLNEEEILEIQRSMSIQNISDKIILKAFNLLPEELLRDFKKIIPITNNLPFSSFSSLIIDKQFFKNIDINDYAQVRKNLLPIIQVIQEYKNNDLFLSNLNVEFAYNQYDNNGTGYCSDYKLFIHCNKLNSSSFQHEYFHAMDKKLATNLKYNVNQQQTYSEINPHDQKLELFNYFLHEMNLHNSSPIDTKNNLSLYFNKHFSSEFNSLQFSEIKESHLFYELEQFSCGIYSDGKGNNKYEQRDNIVKELLMHIDYALTGIDTPKRNLFSIFSEAKDLGSQYDYFSFNAEKLARIYQSQFEINSNHQKIFPLGTEKKLIEQLNHIIHTEFKSILHLDLDCQIHVKQNIIKIRESVYSIEKQKNIHI